MISIGLDSQAGISPVLVLLLQIRVDIGPEQFLGVCTEGIRSNYPILGGDFEGDGVRGRVLAGGADFYRERPDGVAELDARYSLMSEDGDLINVLNRGLLIHTEPGRALAQQGAWPIPEAEYQCHCTPQFQVADGACQWLASRIFIGSVSYPAAHQVLVRCYGIAEA